MKLNRVQIRNFRSIKDLEISFDVSGRILVGINESGKSNILKALAFLSPDTKQEEGDIRDEGMDEKPVDMAYIRFIFSLTQEHRDHIYEEIETLTLGNLGKLPLLKHKKKDVLLRSVIGEIKEGLYIVNLIEETKKPTSWVLNYTSVDEGWYCPSEDCPEDYTIHFKSDESFPLENLLYIHYNNIKDIPGEYLVPVSIDYVLRSLYNAVKRIVQEYLPKCIYWTYDPMYLLPPQINLLEFANNPSMCVPLKNIFLLSGYSDVKVEVGKAKERKNGIQRLLKRLSERATKHMHKVWSEYSRISVSFTEAGNSIKCVIQDTQNPYDFDRRSDGFQRFIAFLFMVSSQAETGKIANTLLLYDEPEASLHPSGCRYLRDELLKISKHNIVVFSTHSIFMIDRDRLGRNIIVSKENEITQIEDVNATNIQKEEVVYGALNFSIYEFLSKDNLIVEGYFDKLLFIKALSRVPSNHKNVGNYFKRWGVTHAQGVPDVQRVAKIMELGKRECVILSDSDEEGEKGKKNYRGHGEWYTYFDLQSDKKIVTGEDFVRTEAFVPILKRIEKEHPELPDFELSKLTSGHVMAFLKPWITNNLEKGKKARKVIEYFKEQLFEDLKYTQIKPAYFEMLAALKSKVEES